MHAARLQDALERLTAAIRDVESELAAMKAEHDPLASHIFVSRQSYRNVKRYKKRSNTYSMSRQSMLSGQDISEYTGQLALVIDAGQLCVGSAGYVNLGKSATREDKSMRYTACVNEEAGNVPRIVDTESGRTGGKGKVKGGEDSTA
jgi:hypothetical protein